MAGYGAGWDVVLDRYAEAAEPTTALPSSDDSQ